MSSSLLDPGEGSTWRAQAARIVEELFPVTGSDSWDLLLDLRGRLLAGADWNAALDTFLRCRERLETDHYLPFYRLRRLLSASLQLEAGTRDAAELTPLAALLNRRVGSLAQLERAVRREMFEHARVPTLEDVIPLRIVERVS